MKGMRTTLRAISSLEDLWQAVVHEAVFACRGAGLAQGACEDIQTHASGWHCGDCKMEMLALWSMGVVEC